MGDDQEYNRLKLVELFSRDRLRLTRYVQTKLFGDDNAEAEDVVSDVMLRLIERADLLAQVENVTAYLYRALAHAVVDLFRRRRARAEVSAPSVEDMAGQDQADPAPGPGTAYAQSQQHERILEALDRLTPSERAVWVAVEIEGKSFKQLADKWGEPLGTLLSRKSRATKRLRELLADEQA
jgi:RNA polymerase sigma factor (sigma-70 family)